MSEICVLIRLMQWIRHGTYKELLVIFTTWVQLTFFWDVTLNEGKVGKSYIFYGRNSHHLAYGFHALDIFPWGPKYWIGHFIFTSRKLMNERNLIYLLIHYVYVNFQRYNHFEFQTCRKQYFPSKTCTAVH